MHPGLYKARAFSALYLHAAYKLRAARTRCGRCSTMRTHSYVPAVCAMATLLKTTLYKLCPSTGRR